MAEYIERETAIRALCDATNHTCNYRDCGKGCVDAQTLLLIPAADVQPVRHGRWEFDDKPVSFDEDGCPVGSCFCSVCGDWLTASDEYAARGRYCPNCGAKMDGGE